MNDERKEIIIKHKQPTLPAHVHSCPRCGGYGYEMDGCTVFGIDETRITPASRCILCGGKRYVEIKPWSPNHAD